MNNTDYFFNSWRMKASVLGKAMDSIQLVFIVVKLTQEKNIFAWRYEDMKGIPQKEVMHTIIVRASTCLFNKGHTP